MRAAAADPELRTHRDVVRPMRAVLLALSVLTTTSPVVAQWAPLRRRPAPTPMREGARLTDTRLPDPHDVWCSVRPRSCECGGYPVPGPRRDSMRALRRRLHACVDRSLRRDPDLHGRVVFEISIFRGQVQRVRIAENSASDPSIVACLARALRVLRLPAVTGRATLL